MTRSLLMCGIASSVFYVLINLIVPLGFDGYSSSSQTVSELSAIGAPTRMLWVMLAGIYIVLFTAFSMGVLKSSADNRTLRIVGWLMVIYSVINIYWPPMHLRGNEPTLTDTLHIVWAMVTVLLMMLIMGFGAAALGGRFRWYTIISMLTHLAFGVLTSLEAPNIPTNGPTPLIGVWERINIAVFMLWIVVLAATLMRKDSAPIGNPTLQGERTFRA